MGLVGTGLIAFFSYLTGGLTKSGSWSLVILGSGIFALAPVMAGYLGLFYLLSYGLKIAKELFFATRLSQENQQVIEKSGPRDAWQVLANCLPLLLTLLWQTLIADTPQIRLCQIAVIAGACGDTFASEIGVLAKRHPRFLLVGKTCPPGLSGGMSLLGSFAGFMGAFIISFAWWLPQVFLTANLKGINFWLPLVTGFLAMIIDSLLGAALQEKRRCQVCQLLTERKSHHQKPTQHFKGIPGFNNDWVNFITGLFTIFFTYGLASLS